MGEKTIWPGSTQLAPVPVVLVGCGDGTSFKYNLITVAWTGIVCSEPPLVAVAVRPERYSYGLLISTGEFTVNMPSCRLAAAVDFCGVRSGRDLDKFKACQLTPRRGSRVAAPLVDECPLSLECRVEQKLELGAHALFIGRIEAVQVESALIGADGAFDLDRADLLAYGHGNYYRLGERLGRFGFSVRK